jgi:hypothetical protein
MPVAYIDANRGNDTTGNGSINNPYQTLGKVANWNAGANGGILLARDSVFDIAITKASNGQTALTSNFNGTVGNRCFIDAYDPPGMGSLTSKPTIRRRMFPVSSDWTWDSTLNFGEARGWYIQFGFAQAFWDARVKVAGVYAQTTNQDTDSNTGMGYINGQKNGVSAGSYVNGMTRDTLRFNFDYSGGTVAGQTGARLYLSGTGLHNPLLDPSTVYGPGAIEVAFGHVFSIYDGGSYCVVRNIRIQEGSGLILFQGTPDTIKGGFELTGCEGFDTSIPIRINNGTGTQAGTVWPFDIHHNNWSTLTGPSFTAFGAGITGYYRENTFSDGNISNSMGGGVYMQIRQSMYGGVRNPFRIKQNTARRWKNGAGNNEFDGSCYYADLNDEGTIFEGNKAFDSFVSFQCGSGRRSEWYGNLAVNCEQFVMMNNAPTVDTNDYWFCNNTFVAANRGTFPHGDTANVHDYHMPIYQVGTAGNLVGLNVCNNLLVNHPLNTGEIPLLLGRDADWVAGKVSAQNNLFSGYGTRLVDADFGSVNRTSSASSLPVETNPGFTDAAAGDYRLSSGSALRGAGVNIMYFNSRGPDGSEFYSTPSVGAFELPRWPAFGMRPA